MNADTFCLYLQGGPGFQSPNPISDISFLTSKSSWSSQALLSTKNNIQKIIFLDQRGTGKSTPITKQTLQRLYPNLFLLDDQYQQLLLLDEQKQKQQQKQKLNEYNDHDNDMIKIMNQFSQNNNNNNNETKTTKTKTDVVPTTLDEQLKMKYPNEMILVQQAIQDVTNYMSYFRADSIVQDAEYIREALLVPLLASTSSSFETTTNSNYDNDHNNNNQQLQQKQQRPYGVCLGQSYGGFCLLTYLSQISYPPQITLFTGGIAPIYTSIDIVYTKLFKRVQQRSLQYYDMYPNDVQLVKLIVQYLIYRQQQREPIILPSGGILTPQRFLQIGLNYLGSSSTTASFASLHNLLSKAIVGWSDRICTTTTTKQKRDLNLLLQDIELSRSFLLEMDSNQSFDHHPIYFWLHEAIYANGILSTKTNEEEEEETNPLDKSSTKTTRTTTTRNTNNIPTSWSAYNVLEKLMNEKPNIWDYRTTSKELYDDTITTIFYGEMIFPWMCHGDYNELSGYGLSRMAHTLAYKTDWKPLYNTTHIKHVLSSSKSTTTTTTKMPICRAAAIVYYDDMYVDFDSSMKVLRNNNNNNNNMDDDNDDDDESPMKNCKIWITNEYQHSGLRDDGATIFTKLYGMATGTIQIPS